MKVAAAAARGWTAVGGSGAVAALSAAPLLAVLRAVLVERAESALLGHPAGAWPVVLQADAPLVGAVLLFGYLGFLTAPSRWWPAPARVMARLAVLALVAIQAVDLGLMASIQMRLQLGDVLRFRRELRDGLTLLAPLTRALNGLVSATAIGVGLLFAVALISAVILSLPVARPCPGRAARWLPALGLGLICVAVLPRTHTRFYGWVYPNVVAANLPQPVAHSDSEAFLADARRHRPPVVPETGMNRRWDVVLLIVESLSSSQSRFFSGIDDFTPKLDALARQGENFPNFVANGFATHLGLVALLAGRIPLPPPGRDTGASFEGFLGGQPFPATLQRNGYHTEYLTASDLGFVRMGDWLRQAGFARVIGSDDTFFRTWPHLAFDAAPDEALVERALSRVAALRANGEEPFLLVVETATGHLPYLDPTGKDNSERGVLAYEDNQIAHLADGLRRAGFFSDGMLIITGDHRKMAPLSRAEVTRFGGSAFARIPLVVVRPDGVSGRVEGYFQQADLPGSLECLLTPTCPTTPWRGDLFGAPPRPPACVLYPMVNDRNLVWTRCGADEGVLTLDGDRTRLETGHIPPQVIVPLLDEVALTRVENTPVPWPRAGTEANGIRPD